MSSAAEFNWFGLFSFPGCLEFYYVMKFIRQPVISIQVKKCMDGKMYNVSRYVDYLVHVTRRTPDTVTEGMHIPLRLLW
jgi:hypothetical protein